MHKPTLHSHITKTNEKPTKEKEHRSDNTGFAKKRVQWLYEVLCFLSSSVLADSFVLRNPVLRQVPNRYQFCPTIKILTFKTKIL